MTLPFTILQETKHWIAVNKPAGWVVERNPWEDSIEVAVEKYLSQSYSNPYVGIVHRLDRVTSGVLVLAKRRSALKRLNQQFAARTITKNYLALVSNQPPKSTDTLQHFLEKNQPNKQAIIHTQQVPNSKPCSLTYTLLQSVADKHLLKIALHTGRFHQIRAQLSYIDCPIIGDKKYGGYPISEPQTIALHAYQLQFDYQTDRLLIESPTPQSSLWQL